MSFETQITDYGTMGTPSGEFVADIITLDDAKNYLKQAYSGIDVEDTLIKEMVQAARQWIEEYINQSIIKKQVVAFTYDELEVFELPYPPVSSISEVAKIDLEGNETAMVKNTDYYEVGLTDKKLVLYKTWATSGNEIVGLKATYIAKMAEIPYPLKDATRALLSEMYVNRGDASPNVQRVPFDIMTKLKPFRRLTL